MSAEAGSPISTYFRVCDGVRVRFADTWAEADSIVLLLAPWPESLWAFRRIWDRVSGVGRVVAIDLPGFGHSAIWMRERITYVSRCSTRSPMEYLLGGGERWR